MGRQAEGPHSQVGGGEQASQLEGCTKGRGLTQMSRPCQNSQPCPPPPSSLPPLPRPYRWQWATAQPWLLALRLAQRRCRRSLQGKQRRRCLTFCCTGVTRRRRLEERTCARHELRQAGHGTLAGRRATAGHRVRPAAPFPGGRRTSPSHICNCRRARPFQPFFFASTSRVGVHLPCLCPPVHPRLGLLCPPAPLCPPVPGPPVPPAPLCPPAPLPPCAPAPGPGPSSSLSPAPAISTLISVFSTRDPSGIYTSPKSSVALTPCNPPG